MPHRGTGARVSGTGKAEASLASGQRTQGEERARAARAARAAPAFRLCRSRSSSVRACLAAPNKRRERCGDSDGKQREQTPQRGASRRKLAQEGQGSAAVLCGGRSLRLCSGLTARTTSRKLAAGGGDFRCVACILKAPTTRRERVGVGDRTPRRRAQRGCTLLH